MDEKAQYIQTNIMPLNLISYPRNYTVCSGNLGSVGDKIKYTFNSSKGKFGGSYELPMFNSITNHVHIQKVIYNDPATVVFWSDGTKTVAKCADVDSYNSESGLAICVLKKLTGATNVKKLFDDWSSDGGNIVEVKDVRRKHNT